MIVTTWTRFYLWISKFQLPEKMAPGNLYAMNNWSWFHFSMLNLWTTLADLPEHKLILQNSYRVGQSFLIHSTGKEHVFDKVMMLPIFVFKLRNPRIQDNAMITLSQCNLFANGMFFGHSNYAHHLGITFTSLAVSLVICLHSKCKVQSLWILNNHDLVCHELGQSLF